MRNVVNFRYLLGFKIDPKLWPLFASMADGADQQVHLERLHLTLCVIAEPSERDQFLLPRVHSALAGHKLSSCPVRLGKVKSGSQGAVVGALGRQVEIRELYCALIALLASRGMVPMHRKSGLHAHVTLGHRPCRFDPFTAPVEWFPSELLLIESEVGRTRHNVLARWPLLPPRQGLLPFDEPSSWRAAA